MFPKRRSLHRSSDRCKKDSAWNSPSFKPGAGVKSYQRIPAKKIVTDIVCSSPLKTESSMSLMGYPNEEDLETHAFFEGETSKLLPLWLVETNRKSWSKKSLKQKTPPQSLPARPFAAARFSAAFGGGAAATRGALRGQVAAARVAGSLEWGVFHFQIEWKFPELEERRFGVKTLEF